MRFLLAASMTVALASLSAAPSMAALVPATGSQYAGVLSQSITTKSAYPGEPVTLTHVTSASGSIAGATMYGTVTSVVKPGQGRSAQLQMTFTKLVMPSGASYAVDGVVTGMQAQTKNNTLKEAAGTVAGMIVGNIVGKTIFHTGAGGLLGAAGGYLVAKNNRADVTVPSGSTVRVMLRSVRRQSSH